MVCSTGGADKHLEHLPFHFLFQCYMPQTHRYDCKNQKGVEKKPNP